MSSELIRVSDAERDSAVAQLREHRVVGRFRINAVVLFGGTTVRVKASK